MVVDCGGGTTDITAYQLTNDANGALKIAEVVGAAG